MSTLPPRRLAEMPIELVGSSASMEALRRALHALARSEVGVLLYGEPGTGKRACAATIHALRAATPAPLRVVALAGLSPERAERLIFGAGGLDQMPPGATVYLQAVDRLSPEVQRQLLEWTEDGSAPAVRVLAGTTVAFDEEVRQGQFSAALYHHLAPIQLHVPPLRERTEDIPTIVEHLRHRWHDDGNGDSPPVVTDRALAALTSYGWPGNVEELVEILTRARAAAPRRRITTESLEAALGARPRRRAAAEVRPLWQLERDYVLAAVARCGGNKSLAARRLGIGRGTLLRLLKSATDRRCEAA